MPKIDDIVRCSVLQLDMGRHRFLEVDVGNGLLELEGREMEKGIRVI